MNILIAGCGTVGSTLAMKMSRAGHTVCIVDRNAETFNNLDDDFDGMTVVGNPIDQDVLRRCGIEGCDAVAAVTTFDNVNVVLSQVAKEVFHIQKVLTRIYDPTREPVFASMGLQIICPTALTVDSAVELLTGNSVMQYVDYGGRAISLSLESQMDLQEVNKSEDRVPVAIIHEDKTITLIKKGRNLKMQKGDRLVTAHIVIGEA